jgi:hypothetical protein
MSLNRREDGGAASTKGATMTVTHLTGFATACQDAMRAVLHAITAPGEERREHLSDAKSAVDKALHDAHSGEEWYLAEHLRLGIKDVETRLRHAS